MKKIIALALVFFAAGYIANGLMEPFSEVNAKAVFSPDGSEQSLLYAIANSEKTLDIMLYQFSYEPLQEALAKAASRGVRVRVILDRKVDSNLYTAGALETGGVEVRWASKEYASTHSKLLIADAKSVFVGSQNWSRHAMKLNREAALWVEDEKIAGDFGRVFEEDWLKAEEWKP